METEIKFVLEEGYSQSNNSNAHIINKNITDQPFLFSF